MNFKLLIGLVVLSQIVSLFAPGVDGRSSSSRSSSSRSSSSRESSNSLSSSSRGSSSSLSSSSRGSSSSLSSSSRGSSSSLSSSSRGSSSSLSSSSRVSSSSRSSSSRESSSHGRSHARSKAHPSRSHSATSHHSSSSSHEISHQSSGGSTPSKIGWSLPSSPQQTSHQSSLGSTPNKIDLNVQPNNHQPSAPAPHSDYSSKSSTNFQSEYQPSGGHGSNTGGAFGQQANYHDHNQPSPPSYRGYSYDSYKNPSTVGDSYRPVNYNPTFGASSTQPTIVIQGASSKPSFAQSVKEGAGFALGGEMVHALVNNHHSHHDSHDNPSSEMHNTIINHNFYNNEKSESTLKPIEEQLKFTSPENFRKFQHEFGELTELLSTKNVDDFLTIESEEMRDMMTNDALFMTGSSENELAWNEPAFKTLLSSHDNYLMDTTINENVIKQQRNEKNDFILSSPSRLTTTQRDSIPIQSRPYPIMSNYQPVFATTPKPNNSSSIHNKMLQTEIYFLLSLFILTKLIQ